MTATAEQGGLADFGVLGVGVMGKNLALNVLERGFSVAIWNREQPLLDAAVAESGGRLRATSSLRELAGALARPRRILLMITAGRAVDQVLADLVPLLEPGDVVIDGGNSWFEDTRRRERELAERGLLFVGLGVSGGSEGARHGPSLMVGGSEPAWRALEPVLSAIAARTEAGTCVAHVGGDGAGHFVKMVHNGLEYADMQLLAEAYQALRDGLGLAPPEIAAVFERWNQGALASFLVEISTAIFRVPDPATGGWLVDRVLDRAEQKGTGRWTVTVALELGLAVPSIAAALDARIVSSRKADRLQLAARRGRAASVVLELDEDALGRAVYGAKIAAYAQGFALLAAGAEHYGWRLDLSELARIWKGGCIIRARFLDHLRRAFAAGTSGALLLADEGLAAQLVDVEPAWRRTASQCALAGLPMPVLSAGLAYVDGMTRARLPQNLVQAQRDAFGAHTFLRDDDPDGPPQHADWLAPTRTRAP